MVVRVFHRRRQSETRAATFARRRSVTAEMAMVPTFKVPAPQRPPAQPSPRAVRPSTARPSKATTLNNLLLCVASWCWLVMVVWARRPSSSVT